MEKADFEELVRQCGYTYRWYTEARYSGTLGWYTTSLIDVCHNDTLLATYDQAIIGLFSAKFMIRELDRLSGRMSL